MEEGSLRCDANVSVRPAGSDRLGTKTEIKNMNSFRSVERAIESEIARQIALLEAGGRIVQETRGWDELERRHAFDAQQGRGARLPLLSRSRSRAARDFARARRAAAARRFRRCPGGASSATRRSTDLRSAPRPQLIDNLSLAQFFDDVVARSKNPQQASNFVLGDLSRLTNESVSRSPTLRSTSSISPS